MSNKAINKDYLLRQLKNFDDDVLSNEYQEKVGIATSENNGLMSSTDKDKLDDLRLSVELTQAAYNALTSEEKMNGTAYLITDASGGGGTGDMLMSVYDSNGDVADAGGIADYVNNEVSGKADKVTNAANGDFAGLDANGNLTDSGKKASDFLPSNTPIPSITNCYQSTDTEETALANADYVPFYDISASAKRKTSWSNIKSVLKSYFDTLYSKVVANPSGTATGTLTKLGIGSDIYDIQGGGGSSDKANKTDIAPIENGTTASQAYAVGQQFYLNGSLYKAKASIASGATFTIGTNCELADCVTEQLIKLVVETLGPSISVPTGSVETYRPSILKSGYKPLGLMGYSFLGTNIDNCSLENFAISSDETSAVITIRNNSNATMTGNIYVKVLYKKI